VKDPGNKLFPMRDGMGSTTIPGSFFS